MPIGDPHIQVECDKCGEVEEFGMTSLAQRSWDNRDLAAKMKHAHWRVDGDETICPECVEQEVEKAEAGGAA